MKKFHWKGKTLLLAVVLVVGCGLGGTLAWLSTTTGEVVNTFTPASVTTEIKEELDNSVKENVTVKNTGDVDAYIRAKIVVNWADAQGNISAEIPVNGTDYTMTMGDSAKWKQIGEYYYYTESVAPNDLTEVLIRSCEPIADKAPEGYALQVTILADGIQSSPDQAIREAWHIDPTNWAAIS